MPLLADILVEKTDQAILLEEKLGISWGLEVKHQDDAGFDVRACITESLVLSPGHTNIIPTGLRCKILLPMWEIQVRSRSGLAAKHNVAVLNSPGTIDYLYRDEIKVILHNFDKNNYYMIKPGERIAQLCVREIPQVRWLYGKVEASDRGGFGSTGKI